MKSEYRNIFKGTFIFGGVQFLQVFVSLIRGKTTAYFIGSEGMGISGLLTSSLAMVITIAGLGCNMSCVKYISSLEKENDSFFNYIRIVQSIFKIIGVLGLGLTLLLAPLLSYISFSSNEYILSYFLLAFFVSLSLYSTGLTSIFQGLQELKCIAKGNIITLVCSTVSSICLYFLFGEKAIVPVILSSPLISAVYFHFTLKGYFPKFESKKSTFDEKRSIFKDFVLLGLPTVIASLIGNLTIYIINAFISTIGTLSDIGLYNAGIGMTNQYIGLLFTAMSTDYFPRLSAVVNNTEKMNDVVNKEGEIVVLFAFPLLSIMILSAPLLIKLLLSPEFLVINSFVKILAFGMFFKAISFCLGYISFAKGDKKTYLLYEGIIMNVLMILLNCFGYFCGNLQGLAYSFVLLYLVYYVLIFFVCKIKYKYIMSKSYFMLSFISGIGLLVLFFLSFSSSMLSLSIAVVLTCAICIFSIVQLERRIQLKDLLIRRFRRK